MKRVIENCKRLQFAISEKTSLERKLSLIFLLLWFRVPGATIRNRSMPQNGSAWWPTRRRENCGKRWTRVAVGTNSQGGRCEPSRIAKTSSPLLATSPRRRSHCRSYSTPFDGRETEHKIK